MGDQLGLLKGALVNYVVRNVKKMVPAYDLPGAVRFNEAIAQGTRGTLKKPDIKPDDIALLQYTGGTTGVSKGAVLLHRNIIANVLQSEAWNAPVMNKVPAGEQPTAVCALPLYHIFAFTVNMMLSMRTGGKTILIPNPRDLPGGAPRSCPSTPSTASRPSTRCSTVWPIILTSTPSTGRTSRCPWAVEWRCRAPWPSCGWTRPAARSAKATVCRKPAPRPVATR
jgi:hypothetical protein